jgi:dTDP-4-amino-4,6-dideoxygalactose transaminase
MKDSIEQLAISGGRPGFSQPITENLLARKLGDAEIQAMTSLMRNGAPAETIGEFCRAFADAHGVRYAIAVNSGTSAVHTALAAVGVQAGDEVILTAVSDVGTISGILAQNAIPIFADVDPRTCNLDPADVESRITDRTKVILAVHLYGQPAQMDALMDIGQRHNLPVIEDCAQAHFAEYKGRKVGSIGDIAAFSFGPGKHMTTIEGGMVITDNDEFARRGVLFGNSRGVERETKKGLFFKRHISLGLNYRISQLTAALGLVQLKKLSDIVRRRRANADLLSELIRDIPGLNPPYIIDGAMHVYWLYPFWLEEGAFTVDNYGFAQALIAEGVPSMPKEYFLLYDHSYFLSPDQPKPPEYALLGAMSDGQLSYQRGLCPRAEQAVASHITITWSEFYTEAEVRGIADVLRKVALAFIKD